jgi:hypothetical protein
MIYDKGHFMFTHHRSACVAAFFGFAAGVLSAQSVISTHSGTLHYFDGSVSIDGVRVESKVGKFSEVKEKSVLSTTQGRAEILLTPGVFLRVGENTEIKMLDNRLLSTRVEVLSGTAVVESDDPEVSVKSPAVTILYKDYEIQPVKFGIFEITSSPSQMRVFKGQALVVAGNNKATIKEGHLMPFSAALLSEKFNEKDVDDLYLWARDRSAYISAANMSSARSLASGNGYRADGRYDPSLIRQAGGFSGNWYYNSFLNMYTYMPYSGTLWSPFGYGYFSPYSIYGYYAPNAYYWNGGGGSRASSSVGVPLTNIGTSSLAAAQVSRLGAGVNTHPTLGSPVRGAEGPALTNSSGAFRGPGFNGSAAQRGGFNPGFNSVGSSPVASSPSGGGYSPAASSGGGGGVSAPAGGGNVGGGGRGR